MDDQPAPSASDDSAVFAPTRVGGARRSRVLASIVVVALGGLVAVGALDRGADQSGTSAITASHVPAATLRAQIPRSSRPPPRASLGAPGNAPGQAVDALLRIDVRPAGSHLFIHGDVFSLDVARVSVTVADSAGHVAATKAVEVPGGSTAFRLGAVPRFDVHFILADEVQADGFVVSATALDSAGHKLATLAESVARAQESM